MGTIISEGMAQPDDPMFTGGVKTFTVRKPKPLSSVTVGAPLDILASFSNDDGEQLTEPDNYGGAS
jgi:hypothetical protein